MTIAISLVTLCSLSLDQTELGQVPTQSIDEHGPLADQQIPSPMHHQCRLLLRRFYRYEAHRWTPNRLADRLGIGHVVLVAFYIGFHIVGRHQARFMAKRN